MGLRHVTLPMEGVQFHPESVLTPDGPHLLANFLRLAGEGEAALLDAARLVRDAGLDGRSPTPSAAGRAGRRPAARGAGRGGAASRGAAR